MTADPCGELLLSGTFAIAAGHPALAGHFPGNPIVPGVAVLQRVLKLLEDKAPESRPALIRDVKFLHPLRPEETCTVEITRSGPLALSFRCRVDGVAIARGTLILDPPA